MTDSPLQIAKPGRPRALWMGWAAPVFVMLILIAGAGTPRGRRLELAALARNLPGDGHGRPQMS
jgi:hypothetical protein